MDSKGLTHIDQDGKVVMVDVSEKKISHREAIASGRIYISQETFQMIQDNRVKKGDIFATGRIAGVMGAKKTWDLIPMCHNILITSVKVDFIKNQKEGYIESVATLKCDYKTGIEMEALTAVSISLLTLYDMLKAIDKNMRISDISLLHKKK